MEMADRLAAERRARLAAERLLEQKQAELFEANRRLGKHALELRNEIQETRTEVKVVRDENQRVMHQLGEATQKIEVVTEQLWSALETMRDGFAMYDENLRLELANPAYLQVFEGVESIAPGASYEHVLKVLIQEGIVDPQGEHPDDWTHRMRARWDMDPIPNETLRLWNNRFVKIRDRRLPDGGIVSLGVDITGLMRMWSAVEEMPDGFVMYDAEDRLLMCNQQYKDIYAKSAPAMRRGASFEEILRYGLDRKQYAEAIGREEDWLEERLLVHRQSETELEQQLEDGRWLRVYERRTRDGGLVGLRVDITQIKQDQERLKEATIRAEAANRAKSAFLANMSHEIRTPMNGVVGMADLLMDTELSEEQQLYADTIRSSGEALLVIINDILDYSKIEAEKLQLHPAPFDLERAIHEVVMLLQPTARDKEISLLVDYDMFLPTRFIGDAGRVRQILTNLLGNAVKFTIQGHVLVRVVGVPGDENASSIHITVEDTGIGIPPDKVDHVFGEFNQVEDERNRTFEGTGLGLAITRRLVELMDGEVWVESDLGKGSCFGLRILLPTEEPAVFETARLPGHLSRVLVVDDHNVNREILSKQLGIIGLSADFCKTGYEAIDHMAQRPDLLLIEQDLPDMSGQDLAAQVTRGGRNIPVILMADNPAQVARRPGLDIAAVLQKPVPRRALFAALEKIGVAHYPEGDSPGPRDPAEGAPPALASPEPGGPLDVLVAEDNKTNQLVFRKMAKDFNVTLRFANNGIEALEAYRDRRPDLIFMDISMPRMDGKQATREIRALENGGPQVPIIAVTAHAMSGDRESILAAGLNDYLTKPLRKAALAEKFDLYAPQKSRHAVS
ncbi:response regulator [Mameliella sp. AT18]|uniref:hybrid sensor histidine kinase/response regulator n=1 Tax=Mameliella sp. AT18 TaxID=3028385 RepID=UPI00084106A8|nr:response regulator [Mameliella sp. AT18]MDD9733505.1 response regulator [Mameliella sp. AT18]ODM46023.1 hybrid sensor histidine kinase/response regulator [Ruegeria sp. PBVC088]